MRVVYEAWNLIDACLVRHALDDAGIPVLVRGDAGHAGPIALAGAVPA